MNFHAFIQLNAIKKFNFLQIPLTNPPSLKGSGILITFRIGFRIHIDTTRVQIMANQNEN